MQTNGPAGGMIQFIEIDPAHPDILYAAGIGGGVFKTTDDGDTWTMPAQFVSHSTVILGLLISPDDPQTVYAVAGSMFKSTDGGESWRVLDEGLGFRCLAVDRDRPLVLVGGTWDGHVYQSANSGENWTDISGNLPGDAISAVAIGARNEFWVGTVNSVQGRLYHTTNGGASWTAMEIGQRAETNIQTVFVDPDDPRSLTPPTRDAFMWAHFRPVST